MRLTEMYYVLKIASSAVILSCARENNWPINTNIFLKGLERQSVMDFGITWIS